MEDRITVHGVTLIESNGDHLYWVLCFTEGNYDLFAVVAETPEQARAEIKHPYLKIDVVSGMEIMNDLAVNKFPGKSKDNGRLH